MIEMTTVIRELRRQLAEAIDHAKDDDLHLELGPIELEMSVAISEESNASGKIRFWVVEAGGDLKDSSTSTQRIKLTLQPVVAGQTATPWIAGRPEPGER